MLQKTILNQAHKDLGATLIDFNGFEMPLYYTTIQSEHTSVRNDVGMFDCSHMGEIFVEGKDTYKFLDFALSQRILKNNKIQYALILNENGGIKDDLMVYPLSDDKALLVVNASNTIKDYEHLLTLKDGFDIRITNESSSYGLIALQGPRASKILQALQIEELPNSMDFKESKLFGHDVIYSRSGYTGEDGYEFYGNAKLIQLLWSKFYQLDVKPIGLGARDTLRFEAAMPLYGNELDETINPFEAGLKFSVDMTKDDFIGKNALLSIENDLKRKLVGFELLERNVARSHYDIYKDDIKIGYVTTGYMSITTQKAIGLAYIDIPFSKLGTEIEIEIRQKRVKAIVRDKKFIKKNNKI